MPLTSADIVFYPSLTGSSEGGGKSGTPIVSGADNNLWADLSSVDLTAGQTRYRKIYVANDSGSDTFLAPVIWISLPANNVAEVIGLGVESTDDDDATIGGTFTQFTSDAVLEAASDGADTRTLTIRGLDDSDDPITEQIVLTGTTPVDSDTTWSVIYGVSADASSGSRTVTLKQGVAGTTRGTIVPGSVAVWVWIDASSKVEGIHLADVGAGESVAIWWRQIIAPGAPGYLNNDDRLTAEQG